MSRPDPVIMSNGRPDLAANPPVLRRVRPAGALAQVTVAEPVRATAPDPAVAPPATSTALVPADPARLPVLVPPDGPRLTLVQRVTRMLQRLGGGQGRHRTGHCCHHWSMFAPHPGARRRSGGRSR